MVPGGGRDGRDGGMDGFGGMELLARLSGLLTTLAEPNSKTLSSSKPVASLITAARSSNGHAI